ncbi:hypothetical protein C0Q70_11695 [Pomacea canaliculata]|uniref:Cytochrome P450 n=1 Tax=Pomacea canaliculata TaxID=400727 RepID=A0A2T7P6P4_POMCA|nr:hypothetical protein C0Q70_11695 [Pomacea canaliculata]
MLGTELLSEIPSLLLLVVLALVSLWWMSTRRPAGVPPGPGFALPLLGHLHLLKSGILSKFEIWRRQYGDVFSLYMGSQLVVVLNGYEVIKDAMVKHADAFSDRPHFSIVEKLKIRGVVDSSGPVWKAQRKTSLEILRELGMGKNILAEKIQEEVKEYIEAIAKKNGEPQDLTRITQVSVSNNICSIVFGKRFEYEDPVFKGYMQRIEENIQAAGTVAVVQTFPVFRFIPGDPFGVRKIFDNVIAILNTLIKPFIDLHVKNFDENCVDDFISAYLREIRKVQHKPSAEFINVYTTTTLSTSPLVNVHELVPRKRMMGTELLPEIPSVLLLVVVAVVSLWWLSTRRPSGVPPGPGFTLPVLGHLHLLRSDPRQTFAAWRRQYGDVFSLYMGSRLVVVLNGYKVIKDSLVKHADAFSDRPHFPVLDSIKSKGQRWNGKYFYPISFTLVLFRSYMESSKKDDLEILREFGMGKNILAEKIQEEVIEYLKALAGKKGQPQELTRMTQVSVSNNICSIVFGQRFEYEDPVFKRYMQAVDENIQGGGSVSLVQSFPILRFIPGDPFGMKKMYENISMVLNTLVKPFVDRHIKDYDENSVDDFISAYLREIRKGQQKPVAEFVNGILGRMLGTELLVETTSILLLVVLTLVSLWWLSTRRPAGVPPGPGFALPLLGHLHLLKSNPRQKFAIWRRQYGDVFSLYLGSQLVVVLNGYKVIKDALVKHADEFSDRPHVSIFDNIKSKGIGNSPGSVCKIQRQTTLEILRELGLGTNILAVNIQTEIGEYLQVIAEKQGQPMDLTRLTQVSVSNNICSIVFGKRFEYEDPVFKKYMQAVEEVVKNTGSACLAHIFPLLRLVPGDLFGIRKIFETFAIIMDSFVQPVIDQHISEYDESCANDFISAYLRETRRVQGKPLAEHINDTVYSYNLVRLVTLPSVLKQTINCSEVGPRCMKPFVKQSKRGDTR